MCFRSSSSRIDYVESRFSDEIEELRAKGTVGERIKELSTSNVNTSKRNIETKEHILRLSVLIKNLIATDNKVLNKEPASILIDNRLDNVKD
jgi:hypothetical protein